MNIIIQRPSSTKIGDFDNDRTLTESSSIRESLQVIDYEEFIPIDNKSIIPQEMQNVENIMVLKNNQDINTADNIEFQAGTQNNEDKNIAMTNQISSNKAISFKASISQHLNIKDQYSSNGSNIENEIKIIDASLFNSNNINNGDEIGSGHDMNGINDLRSNYIPAPRNNSKKKFSFGENTFNLICNQKKKQEYGLEENTLRTHRTRSESMSFRSYYDSSKSNLMSLNIIIKNHCYSGEK